MMHEENFRFDFVLVKETRLCFGQFKLLMGVGNMLKMDISLMDTNGFPVVNYSFKNIKVVS